LTNVTMLTPLDTILVGLITLLAGVGWIAWRGGR
jgi:hypothetical protein